jgi:uncharacterized membrane protein YkvA (DUF1232 family)
VSWLEQALVALAVLVAFWAAAVTALVLAGRRGEAVALARFVPDCVVMVRRLLGDPRLSRARKLVLLPLLAYLVSPIDLVPDFVPIAGQLDDAIVVALALRILIGGADQAVLREHWPGPPESLRLVERFALSARGPAPTGRPR